MNLHENGLETSSKFVQSETLTQLKVQTPLMSFSRFIYSAYRVRLQTILHNEGLKEGESFHLVNFGK